eukprot:766918-Hanusia_phi.AAC.3
MAPIVPELPAPDSMLIKGFYVCITAANQGRARHCQGNLILLHGDTVTGSNALDEAASERQRYENLIQQVLTCPVNYNLTKLSCRVPEPRDADKALKGELELEVADQFFKLS